MEAVRLDGGLLTERTQALALLGAALELPDWWGRNLDALHDCLTAGDFHLILENTAALEESPFGRRLLRVLTDAAQENPGLVLEILDKNAQKD